MGAVAATGKVTRAEGPALRVPSVVLDASDLWAPGAAMLAVAALHPLLPDDTGLSCPLRALTGVPCPLCGMTTSVVAIVHADLPAALAANPGGFAAVGIALWAVAARRGRLRLPLVVVVIALVALWFFELLRFDVVSV